jgi:HK97 family phage prohead protease
MPVIKSNLPTADPDQDWDAGEAIKNVKAFASDDDGNIDFDTYEKAFFWVVAEADDKQGDYKLPFADVIDGKLTAVWNGVAAAMGALNGAQGGVKMPDADREPVYEQIGKYYKKFSKDQPELSSKSIKREIGERVDIVMAFEKDSVKDLGDGQFTATVTTSDVDRMGESIDTQGITTDAYMQNPVVLYGHDYSALPIGKTTKLAAFKNKMTATFQLATKEYPFADTVAQLIKGGYLSAVSIGGVVRQWNESYTEIQAMEMVEFSVVPVPANGAALITGRALEEVTGKSAEQVTKEYHDFQNQAYTKSLKGLDTNALDRHIKSLKDLTVILEAAKAAKTNEKDTPEADEKITLTLRKAGGQISEHGQQIIKLVKAKKED